jgi:transcriptional regulator of acetoin/glycerol metabolism
MDIETELLTLATDDEDDERASVMHRAAIWIIAAKAALKPVEKDVMSETVLALNSVGWNRTQAAAKLGVSRTAIYKRMRKLGILAGAE